MDRSDEMQGLDLVRKAIDDPHAEAYLSADRLHREVRRLQARLEQVRSRGGAYRHVALSDGVRDLLGRLEAGSTLSQFVH